jgi:hypothetical protein
MENKGRNGREKLYLYCYLNMHVCRVYERCQNKISGSGQIRWTQTERMQISEVSFQDLLSIMLEPEARERREFCSF